MYLGLYQDAFYRLYGRCLVKMARHGHFPLFGRMRILAVTASCPLENPPVLSPRDAAAREYGVSLMTLCRWREMEGVTELPPPKFTETEKKKYAEMSLEVGVKEAASRAGVDRSTLSKWRKEFGVRSRAPLISDEERLRFAMMVDSVGLSETARL